MFFAIFEVAEHFTKKQATDQHGLDQFNIEPGEDLTAETLGVRPGNVLVMVRNANALYNLGAALTHTDIHKQDVVVMHLRLLGRASAGEHELEAEDLFSHNEQEVFTKALELAEARGKIRSSCRCSGHGKMGRHPARRAEPAILHHRFGTIVLASSRPMKLASPAWPGNGCPNRVRTSSWRFTLRGPGDMRFTWVLTRRASLPRRSSCCTASGWSCATK